MTVTWSSSDVSEDILDVRIVDSMKRVDKEATVVLDDPDGSALDSYPKGTEIALDVDSATVSNLRRFTGWVSGSKQRGTEVRLELNAFDHFLYNVFSKAFSNESKTDILKHLITELTPITWDASQVTVTDDSTYTRDWRGVTINAAIRELAEASAGESFGVDETNTFFFEPESTSSAPRDFTEGEYFDNDFEEDHKREVNEVVVYYGQGNDRNKVVATDSASQSAYGSNMGVAGGVSTRLSKYYPEISDRDVAEAKANALLAENPSLELGTVNSWEAFGVFPNQETRVVDSRSGIDDTYVVSRIEYAYRDDETTVQLVESTEAFLDFVKRSNEEINRLDHKNIAGRDPTDDDQSAFSDPVGFDKSPNTPAVLESEDLADAATRNFREYVNQGTRLELTAIGVGDDSLGEQTGLVAKVVDDSDGTVLTSTEQKRRTGQPILEVTGPADLRFEIENGSGGALTGVSGRWVYKIFNLFAPDTWMFSVNERNIGTQSITSTLDTNPSEKWSQSTTNPIVSSPYVDATHVYYGTNDNTVVSRSVGDGSLAWQFTGPTGSVKSSPCVIQETVFVGSNDNSLYALDASDGSELWSFSTSGSVVSSPAFADRVVFVGSGDGNVYAINAADGTEKWRFTGATAAVDSSPAVINDDRVYVGSDDGNVYALDASDGSELWSFSTGAAVKSSPTHANGTIFVGSDDGTVYAINEDGSEKWSASVTEAVQGSPAVSSGVVFVGRDNAGSNGTLYALDAEDGSEEWSVDTGGPAVNSDPAVLLDQVVVGWGDGTMHAYNANDGAEEWSYDTGGAAVSASPAVRDGTVYVGVE